MTSFTHPPWEHEIGSETAFSLGYTADDSLIVRIVLERHQELFHGHCH